MSLTFTPISVAEKLFENEFISRKRNPFNDKRLYSVWTKLDKQMETEQTIVVQELASSPQEANQYYKFLNNKRVMIEEIIKMSCELRESSLLDRSILILGDSSSFNLMENKGRIKDVERVGFLNGGKSIGFHTHPNLAISPTGDILGLADVIFWSRLKEYKEQQQKHVPLKEKEFYKWHLGAKNAHEQTIAASNRTFIYDREADSYELLRYIQTELEDDLIIRIQHNRSVEYEGEKMSLDACLSQSKVLGEYELSLSAQDYYSTTSRKQIKRKARTATIALKASKVSVLPPQRFEGEQTFDLYVIEAKEVGDNVPEDEEPVHWKLWTTHPVTCFEEAKLIVYYYTLRWIIEQFFRTLKKKGFKVESSQMGSFDGILKQTAMAMKAAVTVLQLVYARNKENCQTTDEVFDKEEQEVLHKVNDQLQGRTEKQQNPFKPQMLSWAAWIIGRLGGWKGYQSQKPPGPGTMKRGLDKFYSYMEMYKIMNLSKLNLPNTT